ncbi:hypothetical protein ACVW1C_006103 [Bradyrhizobium sp. USDA 4011]
MKIVSPALRLRTGDLPLSPTIVCFNWWHKRHGRTLKRSDSNVIGSDRNRLDHTALVSRETGISHLCEPMETRDSGQAGAAKQSPSASLACTG